MIIVGENSIPTGYVSDRRSNEIRRSLVLAVDLCSQDPRNVEVIP